MTVNIACIETEARQPASIARSGGRMPRRIDPQKNEQKDAKIAKKTEMLPLFALLATFCSIPVRWTIDGASGN